MVQPKVRARPKEMVKLFDRPARKSEERATTTVAKKPNSIGIRKLKNKNPMDLFQQQLSLPHPVPQKPVTTLDIFNLPSGTSTRPCSEDLHVKTRSMLKKQKEDQTNLIKDLQKVGGNEKVIQELKKDISVSLHKEIVEEGTKRLSRT